MFRKISGAFLLLAVLATNNQIIAQDTKIDLEALKEQADVAYRQRNFPKTIDLSNQVLAKAATDHVALYLRGSARVELGIVTGNVESIRQGIADSREAIRHEGKGKAEYYLPYIYGMSNLADMEGKPNHAKTAKTVVDSVLGRTDLTDEQRANLYYQRAQADMRLKDAVSAEADLNKAIQLQPTHLAAHMSKAELAATTKTAEEALQVFGQLVKSFPDNPVVFNNRGMFLQSQGRGAEAISDFNQAISLDGRFIPAYINRGFAYIEAGDSASAEEALSQALKVDPSQAGAQSLRATARLNQNKVTEALSDYKKVVELAPENPMAHADLGFAQFFSGDFAGAFSSFSKSLSLDGNMRFLVPWKLASAIRGGKYQQADYQVSIAKAENSRDWIDSLVLFQLGQVDAAKLLKSIHPDDKEAQKAQLCEGYYFIGMELLRRNRKDDAISYWKQATRAKLPKLSAYRGAVFALKNSGVEIR